MVALAATSSATPSLQSTLLRSRVEAARREADQAQAYADNLRSQADAQEQVVQQARERVKTVEKSASAPVTAPNTARTNAPARQPDPTYINALAEVFQAAKPLLSAELSPTQTNVVKSSLLVATQEVWSASAAAPAAPIRYQTQVFQAPSQALGRVLNISA